MKECIIRLRSDQEDCEILIKNQSEDEEIFKAASISSIQECVKSFGKNVTREKPILIPEYVIAEGIGVSILRQDEMKKVVTYGGKSYNVQFPNALYVINYFHDSIVSIEAYSYKKWEGIETRLFKYPMPNMLAGDSICIGSAPKKIKRGNLLEALEKVIFTQFTHSQVNNIRSFKSTADYFAYLSENVFPYKLLMSANKKVKELVR